jgi:glycosyltransferase involved in cell wall biosynthesis
MNIGVYFGGNLPNEDSGGAFTYVSSLLEYLELHESTQHKYFIFCNNVKFYKRKTRELVRLKHIQYIFLNDFSEINDTFFKKIKRRIARYNFRKKYLNFFDFNNNLNNALMLHKIDVMWFLSPTYRHVKCPFLYTVWDLQHRRYPFFPEVSFIDNQFRGREQLYNFVIPRASYIITASKETKHDLEQFYGFSSHRIKILKEPTPKFAFDKSNTDNDFFMKEYGIKKPYIFYPAQFWAHKNHIVILEAIKILKQIGYDMSVVFTGADKGNLFYIKERITNLKLQESVFLLGFVEKEELVLLYKNAIALVYASLLGLSNIPPLEAFSLMCPVICADVPGMREQLGDAAMFFNSTDEQELAQKILLFYENNEMRKKYLERGLKRSQSWMAKDYVLEIEKILNEFKNIRRCWGNKYLSS